MPDIESVLVKPVVFIIQTKFGIGMKVWRLLRLFRGFLRFCLCIDGSCFGHTGIPR